MHAKPSRRAEGASAKARGAGEGAGREREEFVKSLRTCRGKYANGEREARAGLAKASPALGADFFPWEGFACMLTDMSYTGKCQSQAQSRLPQLPVHQRKHYIGSQDQE